MQCPITIIQNRITIYNIASHPSVDFFIFINIKKILQQSRKLTNEPRQLMIATIKVILPPYTADKCEHHRMCMLTKDLYYINPSYLVLLQKTYAYSFILHAGKIIKNIKVGIRNTIIKVSSPMCPKYKPFIAKNAITINIIPYAVLVINL